jgi:hypothetical protein
MRPSPDPVWILFRRRTFSRLAYWCLVLGFDLRDRSLTNRFYFIYFCAFWLAWFVAVFALLGSALAGSFGSLPAASPPALAVLLGAFMLAAWGLVQLWQVTGRSPFVFSEPDATLLCQAPVRRRSVGVAWFLMDWFGTVLPFAAGAVMLSFALTEAALPHLVSLRDLPAYFAASLRALAIVLPLQMGLQAGLWGLGAWRLRRVSKTKPGWLHWLRLAVLIPGLGLLAALFLPDWRAIVLAPLTFPLQAAFGEVLSPFDWMVRAGLGLLVLALGMAVLLVCTSRMHLGRAAQETRLQSIIRLHQGALNFELAGMLKRQSRMKATRPPSRLPVRSGAWMLAWKDLVQSWRTLRASQVLRWVWVFFLGLGIFLAPGWVVQLIIGGLWAVSLGDLATGRLRSDLARWWLLRSLPLRNSDLLLAQLGPACGLGLLLGWLALALAGPPSPFGWLAAALLPFLVASAAMGSARDILDNAKARVLMTPSLAEENVPRQDIQGVLIVLISVGLPLGLLAWGRFHPGGLVWGLMSLPVAALIAVLMFQLVLSVYRWIM